MDGARHRTRKQRIQSLEARREWLVGKVAALAAAGKASNAREELQALEWALPILRREVEADGNDDA